MVFHINDPKGFRMPYFPEEDFRIARRGDPAKAVEPFETRPVKEWPKEKFPPKKPEDTIERASDQGKRLFSRFESTPLTAAQIMTRDVTTLHYKAKLKDAWLLVTDTRFRHLPIVNDEGKLVGVLSDRRINREMVYEHGDRPVEEIMVTPVISGAPETEVSHIAKLFIERRIGCMPILDSKGDLVGIITRSDVLRTLVKVTPIQYRA